MDWMPTASGPLNQCFPLVAACCATANPPDISHYRPGESADVRLTRGVERWATERMSLTIQPLSCVFGSVIPRDTTRLPLCGVRSTHLPCPDACRGALRLPVSQRRASPGNGIRPSDPVAARSTEPYPQSARLRWLAVLSKHLPTTAPPTYAHVPRPLDIERSTRQTSSHHASFGLQSTETPNPCPLPNTRIRNQL